MSKRVLIIDNYDSFVHILADEFQRRHCDTAVFRSNWPVHEALAHITRTQPDLLVLSPGPGRPEDAALCLALLSGIPEELPVFGVCLGMQCLVHHFGGRVGPADEVVHGKPARVDHSCADIFAELESPMQVGRYHSLIGIDIPDVLVVDADYEGVVMAVHHRQRPIWGVQFHPESVLTPFGGKLIENLLKLLERRPASIPAQHSRPECRVAVGIGAGPREASRTNETSSLAAGCVDLDEFEYVLSPDAKLDEQIDFLDKLNGLSITGAELAAMAQLIRSRCVRVHDVPKNAVDLCGTGGDRSGTFNVSTIASFVVAGAGIPVAKHGNRAVSSKCGSADCLEQLGISTSLQPNEAARMIREVGIAFMFAPLFHPALAQVSAARKALSARGEKSVFNILGPLVNPAFVTRQAVGVFREDLIAPVAEALMLLGVHRAMVFHGQGLDEVTLTGETQYGRLQDGRISTGRLTPEELGFRRCSLDEISGGNSTENARLCRGILEGRVRGARRDMVVLNAAVAISVGSDKQVELQECVDLAAESIDSSRALDTLKRVAGNP